MSQHDDILCIHGVPIHECDPCLEALNDRVRHAIERGYERLYEKHVTSLTGELWA